MGPAPNRERAEENRRGCIALLKTLAILTIAIPTFLVVFGILDAHYGWLDSLKTYNLEQQRLQIDHSIRDSNSIDKLLPSLLREILARTEQLQAIVEKPYNPGGGLRFCELEQEYKGHVVMIYIRTMHQLLFTIKLLSQSHMKQQNFVVNQSELSIGGCIYKEWFRGYFYSSDEETLYDHGLISRYALLVLHSSRKLLHAKNHTEMPTIDTCAFVCK